jgi:hypothetical protein
VYQHKDGEPRWIKASDIYGAGCAEKLRRAWLEPKVQPGLTPADKQAVLETDVRIILRDGGPVETRTIRDVLNSGYRFSYRDYKALERKGLTELEVAYLASLSGRTVGGSTAPSIGTTYAPTSGYPGYAAAAYAPPARSPVPASAYLALPAVRTPPAVGPSVARAPFRGG